MRVAAVALVVLAACGTKKDKGEERAPATDEPPAATAAPAAPAAGGPDLAGFCQRTMAAQNPTQCWGKDARSTAMRTSICREVLADAARRGKIKVSADRLAVCERDVLAAIETLPNARSPAHLADLVPSCRGVTVGTVAGGGECLGTMECEPGLVCKQMVCGPPDRAGEKCQPAIEMTMVVRTSTCGDGLWCKLGGADGATCEVQAEKGGACTTTEGCVAGLRCRGDKCVPAAPSKAGEACDEHTDCPTGHFCGVMSDRCEPLKPDGESCMSNTECANMCVTGSGVSGKCGPCPT